MLNINTMIPEEIEFMNVLTNRVNNIISKIESALKTCDRETIAEAMQKGMRLQNDEYVIDYVDYELRQKLSATIDYCCMYLAATMEG